MTQRYKRPLVLVGTRSDLEPIVEIAEELDIPILGILDRFYVGQTFQDIPVLGSDLDLLDPTSDVYKLIETSDFFVCTYFGGVTNTNNPNENTFLLRQERIDIVRRAGCNLINLIHPDSRVSRTATLGRNILVLPSAYIESHTQIGSFGTFMYRISVAHHSIVGENCTMMPDAGTGGTVTLGKNVTIGVNTRILSSGSNTAVGDNAVIGPGLTILRDIPANSIVQVNGKILENKQLTPEFYLENDIGFTYRKVS